MRQLSSDQGRTGLAGAEPAARISVMAPAAAAPQGGVRKGRRQPVKTPDAALLVSGAQVVKTSLLRSERHHVDFA